MFRFLAILLISGAVTTLAAAPAGTPAPPPETPDAVATPPTSVAPAKGPASFAVHHLSTLVVAPASLPLDQEVSGFAQLNAKVTDRKSGVTSWGEGMPTGVWSLNYHDAGFTGIAGYYHPPGSTPPWTVQNSVIRGIDFKYRFQDRKENEVGVTVEVNDNRATPAAADHQFQVNRTLKSEAFNLIKLGEPQDGKQAWLALTVDGFADPGVVKMPVMGTLSADKKVELKFTSTAGQKIDTTKMRGKVVLVDFWATWCGPCIESLPRVEALYRKFHGRGLEVIGVSLDDEQARVDVFLKHHPHPWPQAPAAGVDENPLARPFRITGIPFYLLIDKTGTAEIVDVQDPAIESAISENLGRSD